MPPKILMIIGILFLLFGILPYLGVNIPFGKLPGDFCIQVNKSVKIIIPLTSCLILGFCLSVLLKIFRHS
ncbi:MAG: DUF2905 domain-containing protein [Candidatus Brocadiae bacterium]|nr:DUF2905 domain-containing protein [Candidatus Brocadiia bacterium]